jgi:hypothetical protein
MSKPKHIVSLLRQILKADPLTQDIQISLTGRRPTCFVKLTSVLAREFLEEMVDLPVLKSERQSLPDPEHVGEFITCHILEWDCSEMTAPPKELRAFNFDGRTDAKRSRRVVTAQEEEGASLIGGIRHVGSGALSDLKSDASSETWQQEAKQTKHKSFSLKLDVLEKISKEARAQDKQPMLFLWFTAVPDHMAVADDWVIIPATVFAQMERRSSDD